MKKPTTPALPATVWSSLGPVAVVVVEGLKDEKGVDLFGCWDATNRQIAVRAGLHPTTALATCVHEWLHCVMYDAGIKLPPALEERVADCVSTAIVADLLSHQ